MGWLMRRMEAGIGRSVQQAYRIAEDQGESGSGRKTRITTRIAKQKKDLSYGKNEGEMGKMEKMGEMSGWKQ